MFTVFEKADAQINDLFYIYQEEEKKRIQEELEKERQKEIQHAEECEKILQVLFLTTVYKNKIRKDFVEAKTNDQISLKYLNRKFSK